MAIVMYPTKGRNLHKARQRLITRKAECQTCPLTFPTTCFRSSHFKPLYKPMSSTGLLSPFVSNFWSGSRAVKRLSHYIRARHRKNAAAILFMRVMRFQHSVHDGNLRSWDLVNNYIPSVIQLVRWICQKYDISSRKCRLH